MKKYIFVFIAIICLTTLLMSSSAASDRKEIEDIDITDREEVTSAEDLRELYGAFLKQEVEEIFMTDEYVESAEATVCYNEELDGYSIQLLLETSEEISEERVALYKEILLKMCAEATLTINGKTM